MSDSLVIFVVSFFVAFVIPIAIYIILSNTSRETTELPSKTAKKKKKSMKGVLKVYDAHEFHHISDKIACPNADAINIRITDILVQVRNKLANATTMEDAQAIIFELQNTLNSFIIDGSIQDQNVAQLLYQSTRTFVDDLLHVL